MNFKNTDYEKKLTILLFILLTSLFFTGCNNYDDEPEIPATISFTTSGTVSVNTEIAPGQ